MRRVILLLKIKLLTFGQETDPVARATVKWVRARVWVASGKPPVMSRPWFKNDFQRGDL